MKTLILEKSVDMFLTLGVKSVTMDDLARDLGISKKTIYTYFKNKTELIQACADHMFNVISDQITCICKAGKNPIEELYEIKKTAMLYLKNEKSAPQYQLQKYYPKIYGSLTQKQFVMMQDCVQENVEKGMAQGIYRDNLNVEFVSRIYFSGIVSIKNQDLFPSELFEATALLDQYLEYHLRGLVTPKGRKILNQIIESNHD